MAFMRLLSHTNAPYNVMQNCENLDSNITYKTEKYENVKTIFKANIMKMNSTMPKSSRARIQRRAQYESFVKMHISTYETIFN